MLVFKVFHNTNSKKLSLSWCNVGCVMDSFDDRSVLNMNVSDRHSNIILNTCIQDNKSMWVVKWSCDNNIVELISAIYKIIVFAFDTRVKWKMTRKYIIHIDDRSLDVFPLIAGQRVERERILIEIIRGSWLQKRLQNMIMRESVYS